MELTIIMSSDTKFQLRGRRMTFPASFPRGAFDAETTKAMGEAYNAACEIVGQRIIDAAREGERHPRRLLADALRDDFYIGGRE